MIINGQNADAQVSTSCHHCGTACQQVMYQAIDGVVWMSFKCPEPCNNVFYETITLGAKNA